jgi:predicted ATP-dependent serine protease
VDLQVYKAPLLAALNLGGLIHVWGSAGSGKSLLAVALASDVSKESRVEWINTDAKKSFVTHLKQNILGTGGRIENITVTFTENCSELLAVIDDLPNIVKDTSLIIIDPITRVLDMTRQDPILWGREIIEEVLPTLTGIVSKNDVDIIIISESRMMDDSSNQAVHHKAISKWVDHDLCLTRNMNATQSQVLRMSDDGLQELAVMELGSNGTIEVIPRLILFKGTKGENGIVW